MHIVAAHAFAFVRGSSIRHVPSQAVQSSDRINAATTQVLASARAQSASSGSLKSQVESFLAQVRTA